MGTGEILLTAPPGLEAQLCAEAVALGLPSPRALPGGVVCGGSWPEAMRANLWLRGATRVLVRVAEFRALHLAQLDKRARKLAWADLLRTDVPVRVEATTRGSRIYHAGAARARIEAAIADVVGAPLARGGEAGDEDGDAEAVTVKLRIEADLCTVSIDSSGALLHRRGHKQAVNAAPMRETMAALFLAACGYRGDEPVLDPMCGSGTFPIEAAEIAAGLAPGRSRSFAFERLAGFDAGAWAALRAEAEAARRGTSLVFHGSDRDAGAVAMSRANAVRAGVGEIVAFRQASVSDAVAPPGPPGLVMVNPPYGGRIGRPGALRPLYAALGATLATRFAGWRVGLIAADAGLARATGLPFETPGPPVPHGPLKVRLFRTGPLPG